MFSGGGEAEALCVCIFGKFSFPKGRRNKVPVQAFAVVWTCLLELSLFFAADKMIIIDTVIVAKWWYFFTNFWYIFSHACTLY